MPNDMYASWEQPPEERQHRGSGQPADTLYEEEQSMISHTSKIRAFSLVELVIVVVIIGVIAAIAVPRISRGAKGAGESALRGSLASWRDAIDMYSAAQPGAFPGPEEANLL